MLLSHCANPLRAMGAARSAGEEARTAMQSRVREFVADMDLVERDEVEALRAIAISALEKVEALEKIHPAVFEGSKSKVAARRAKPAPETTTDAPPSTARLAAAGSASTAARNFGST